MRIAKEFPETSVIGGVFPVCALNTGKLAAKDQESPEQCTSANHQIGLYRTKGFGTQVGSVGVLG